MIPVYRGVKHQYGYGLGSLFKAAVKSVTPLLKPVVKSGLNALKKEGMKQGMNVARDILVHRKNPKSVLISRGKETVKNLGKKVRINKPKSKSSSQLRLRSRRGKVTKNRHKRTLDIFD